MNALSPFSSLIAPAPTGWTAAAGLVAPVETVAPPDGFAGWLPTTAPSATLAGAAVTNVLTNASVSLAANDVAQAGPTAANAAMPSPPKPIGGVPTTELRLPMTSIASSATDAGATRGFVPKTMPIAGTGSFEPGTADVQPVMIAALAETPVTAAAPVIAAAMAPAASAEAEAPADAVVAAPAASSEGTVDPATARLAPASQAERPGPSHNQARGTTKPPSRNPVAVSAPLPVTAVPVDPIETPDMTADRVPSGETADPASATAAGRQERMTKPADDAAAVSAMPAAINLPLPTVAPAAAVATPQATMDGQEGESPAREARARSTGGTTAGPQVLPASAPVAATDRIATARVSAEADKADAGTPGGDSKSAGKAVAADPAIPDRTTGEAKPTTPAAPSFRAQVDAVQQAAKPAPAQPAPPPVPVVQASHIGHDTAVAIARHVAQDGGETLTIRIAPAELGRIEVRLAFDDGGTLRATVAADQPASLDLLRRDTDTLVRALGDAGVRADQDSLRFDMRSDTGASTGGFASSGQSGSGGGQGRRTPFSAGPYATLTAGDEPAAETRILSPRGRVDLMA